MDRLRTVEGRLEGHRKGNVKDFTGGGEGGAREVNRADRVIELRECARAAAGAEAGSTIGTDLQAEAAGSGIGEDDAGLGALLEAKLRGGDIIGAERVGEAEVEELRVAGAVVGSDRDGLGENWRRRFWLGPFGRRWGRRGRCDQRLPGSRRLGDGDPAGHSSRGRRFGAPGLEDQEELRSTMEELETSKEELQSINEELQTVNQQNRHKVEELAQLSSDLQNHLAATDIATLFLDRELRILRFTPRLGDLFRVRAIDQGRPIAEVTNKLGYNELESDAQVVLKTLMPVEREVQDQSGKWYLMRILPYRGAEDRIEGFVVTFIDIHARKLAEQNVLREKDFAETIIQTLHEPLVVLTSDFQVRMANPAFYAQF